MKSLAGYHLCQQQPSIKEILIGNRSAGISSQKKYIFLMQLLMECCYTLMKSLQRKYRSHILSKSLVINQIPLSISRFRLRYEAQSPNFDLFSENTSSIQRNVKLEEWGFGSFRGFFQNPLHEICYIRIKERVELSRTVITHSNEDCLLTSTATKLNKYVVNQNPKHSDDGNFR